MNQSGREKLEREARVLQMLAGNQRVVNYIDHGSSPEPFLVMEYVPTTLHKLVVKKSITLQILADYLNQMSTLLIQLRDLDIVHGDIKMDNLGYIPEERKIKMFDFGLARVLEENSLMEATRVPAHNAPELREMGLVTKTTDWYSTGFTFTYLATGLIATNAEEAIEFLTESDLIPKPLPKELDRWVKAMMRKNPNLRSRVNLEEMRDLAQKISRILN